MMKIEGDERQLKALAAMIDAAVRSLGVRGAGDALYWVAQIEAALKEAKGEPRA